MTRVLRSIGAAVVLAFLLVGVPVLTWRVAGWPLPAEVPTWDEMSRRFQQGDITGTMMVKALAVVVWLAWAQLAWVLLWELAVNLRRDLSGRPARRPPLVIAPIGHGVAHLLSVVFAVGTIAAPMPAMSLATVAPVGPAVAMGHVDGGSVRVAPQAAESAAPVSTTKVWFADRYDSMWAIAEQALGDGAAVDQLLALNPRLTAAHTFRDGERVVVPGHAAIPAGRTTEQPNGEDIGQADESMSTRVAERPSLLGESNYRVEPGDGLWDVAEALLGDGSRYEELVPMLIGQEVAPGVTYDSEDQPIQPGWVFHLPSGSELGSESRSATADREVVVRPGDSLWSIAEHELGDPRRWPEIWEGNQRRIMDDGRVFDDPDLIIPGWTLDLAADEDGRDGEDGRDDQDDRDDREDRDDRDDRDDDATVGDPPDSAEAPDGRAPSTAPDLLEPAPNEGDVTPAEEVAEPDRINVWEWDAANATPAVSADAASVGSAAADAAASGSRVQPGASEGGGTDDSVRFLTVDRAAMLSAGILALLGVRRRNRLRRSPPRATLAEQAPRAVATERALRSVDAGERFTRVDIAIRAAAPALIEAGKRVVSAIVATDGEVVITTSGPVDLPLPWTGDAARWVLPAITPLELLAPEARRSGAPCPALVQLGSTADGRDVYVDLEAIEAVEVGGPTTAADAVLAAIATSLAASVMAEVASLVTVDVPTDAMLDHRHHVAADDAEQALAVAVEALGTIRSQRRSTFELRALGTSGEAWEPAVVLVGSESKHVRPPADRRGIAVVSSAPIHGPSSRLAPVEGDEWELLPLGLRFIPIGLPEADIEAIAELAAVPAATVDGPVPDACAAVVATTERSAVPASAAPCATEVGETPAPGWELLVTTFGNVAVLDREGAPANFERSKTVELVAWLVAHRHRSTRSSARAALWEMDVRDATFANVVSEARRALARLVEPPDGEEWIDRTLTDALPLHGGVWSDGDVLEHALEHARMQPPTQAIATLRPAVELINGMPFAGTSYLWPDAEGITSQLVLLATTATCELAAHHLSVGDVAGVFAATARGLQVLPGHEELVGLRMQAHAKAGDHAGVRAEWESYERVLVADPWSDGEPSPKLVDLRRTLLSS